MKELEWNSDKLAYTAETEDGLLMVDGDVFSETVRTLQVLDNCTVDEAESFLNDSTLWTPDMHGVSLKEKRT